MLNSHTAALRRITNAKAQKALINWFTALSERYSTRESQRINGRAWRAELKRMEPPYGAMMCEGYGALRHSLLEHMPLQPLDEMALALFASVAAHIKKHNEKTSFAAQLGKNSTAQRRAFLLYVLNVCKRLPIRKRFVSC